VVENYIGVKVFVLGCIVIPTSVKVDYAPIMNMLWLDLKDESVQMCSTQQPVLIEMV